MNITIFNEGRDEKRKPEVLKIYPDTIGGALKEIVEEMEDATLLTIGNLYDEECGLTEEILEKTDVLIYWSHGGNREFPDAIAARIHEHVLRGMGFIVLHSAIGCKAFKSLMGTTCTFRYQHDVKERVICCNKTHPIAQGVEERFELEMEESYGEYMDIPKPDDVIFLGWFDNGEACRSGCTFTRGYGKIFMFQPGHETTPTFYHPQIKQIIKNACRWATPTVKADKIATSIPL